MKQANLLANGIGIVVAVAVICLIVAILLDSADTVAWQFWGMIVGALTFCLTLVVSVWWYDRWRKR